MDGQVLLDEINQQPYVIERLLSQEFDNVQSISRKIQGTFNYVMIAARGTSDNAARYAKYLLGQRNRIPVVLAAPSLYTIYEKPPKMDKALVIAISQSGYPPDVVAVLKEAKAQGQPTIAITNDTDSPLAKTADYVINLHAEEEKAIAATKTYTATLVALAMLSTSLSEEKEISFSQLELLPGWIRQTLSLNEGIVSQARKFAGMDNCFVISRGYEYATAHEISLKVKELTHIAAEPYSSADFMHGPIGLMDEGSNLIVIAPPDKVIENIREFIIEAQKSEATLFIVSDEEELLEKGELKLRVSSGMPAFLFPVASVIPGQLFSLGLALGKGLNPDQPERLSKVTLTW